MSDLYPGLTLEERALAATDPLRMLQSYKLSYKAEDMCARDFPRSETNDGSDACRHYVWANLLYKEYGREFASKVLEAHEMEPLQSEEEKAMDLANNLRGMNIAEKLLKQNQFSDEKIMEQFRQDLRFKRLIILEKRK